jgi:Transcriptional regulator PadR-like family
MLILQTLQWGPNHGHGVGQAINLKSGGLLSIEAGSVYPALHRLERQGLIMSPWKLSAKQSAWEVLPTDRDGTQTPGRRRIEAGPVGEGGFPGAKTGIERKGTTRGTSGTKERQSHVPPLVPLVVLFPF